MTPGNGAVCPPPAHAPAARTPLTRSIPEYPRLHSASGPIVARPTYTDGSLAELCHAFEQATGWPLRFAPYNNASDAAARWSAPAVAGADSLAGSLRIETSAPASLPAANLECAAALADALTDLLNDKHRAESALRRREAELAAGVPVVPRDDDGERLAELLESLLWSAADAAGCQAAGLYLLDETTSELKLRSSWGLPCGRLSAPARSLGASPADLEALSGHAVVLDEPSVTVIWQPPESCAAAVCVPVSSFANILGTLWLFAESPRQFTDREISTAEIVAGRLAAELERAMLAAEAERASDARRQLDELDRQRRDQTPTTSPLCDGWEVAAHVPDGPNAGGFCDWFPLSDDRLAIVLAQVAGDGVCAAMTAASLRAALRAHGERINDPARLLEAANRTLWTVSAGDQTASAVCLMFGHGGNQVQYAWAGVPSGWWFGRRAQELFDGGLPLGADPLALYASRTLGVAPGELLIMAGDPAAFAAEPSANAACLDMARWVQAHPPTAEGIERGGASHSDTYLPYARVLADQLGQRPAARDIPLLILRRT
jgi:phosphoserine phosphatase RsbU/P